MQKQVQITEKTKLLNEDGTLHQPGYCVRNLYEYNRECIAAPKMRIKEWDFYQISNGRYMIQLVYANISMGAAGFASILDMETGKQCMAINLAALTVNNWELPRNGDQPYQLRSKLGSIFDLAFDVEETSRRLTFEGKALLPVGKNFKVDLTLDVMPGLESITIAIPYREPQYKHHFFLTQKLNCMPVTGSVVVGNKKIDFSPDDTFAVLDWGRGVWPYETEWYWGNGSTRLPDGKLFGFELTWGFGDTINATETAIFYDGKTHKIGNVTLQKDPHDWLKPWVFTSEDGRFEMTMTPKYDNNVGVIAAVVGAKCHQVHGKWNGTVTLDDGTKLEIRDMYAFCENMHSKW